MKSQNASRWIGNGLRFFARVAIGAALLTVIALKVNVSAASHTLRAIAPQLAAIAIAVILCAGVVATIKWRVLLLPLGVRAPFGRLLQLTYIAATWNLALPGGESGNIVKALMLARQTPGKASAVWASLLVDQLSLAVAQLLIALGTLTLATKPPPDLRLWIAIIVAGLAVLALVYAFFLLPIAPLHVERAIAWLSRMLAVPAFLLPRGKAATAPALAMIDAPSVTPTAGPGEWIGPLWRAFTSYRGHERSLALAIALSIAYYGTLFSSYWLAARGLGIAFGFPDIAWVTALAGIASSLPITVFGLGVRETIIIFFLTQRGVTQSTALAFSLAVLALNIILGLPGLIAQLGRGATLAPQASPPQ